VRYELTERLSVEVAGREHEMAGLNRDGNLLITVAGWTGQTFAAWFPEAILIPDKGTIAANWEPGTKQNWQWDSHEKVLWHRQRGEGWELEAQLRGAGATALALTLEVNNLGERPWNAGWVNVCMRLCHADDFADGGLSRTYLHFEEGWRPIGEVEDVDAGKRNRIYLLQAANEYYVNSLSSWWQHVGAARADKPIIAVTARQGRRTVAMLTRQAAGFVCNLDAQMRCIHSNPVLPALGAGERASIDVWLLFVEGTVQDTAAAAGRMLGRGAEGNNRTG